MKLNFLEKTGMSRLGVLILMLWCGIFAANAIESDDINAAILVEGSVPVKWTNDATNPWYIVESTDGNYVRTPETEGNKIFTSTLSFTYSSAYPTEITFSGYRYSYYNDDALTIKIDGVEKEVIRNRWYDHKYMVPAGAHTVDFVSVSSADISYDSYWAGIRNLRVWECKELETACLTDDSMPLTFANDAEHIWITENGYIRSTNENVEGEASSKISTTFTIDKPSLFSFEFRNQTPYRQVL